MKVSFWIIHIFLLLGCVSGMASSNIDKDKEEILVRKIGHEIARYVGDSIQGLKPIIELEPGVYQIEFNGPFSFFSDSVINIIHREMRNNKKEDDYVVKVAKCASDDVIFAYFISPLSDDSVIPCQGRIQDEECYTVSIGFIPPAEQSYDLLVLLLAGPLIFGLIIYGFKHNRKLDEAMYEDDLAYNMADMNNIAVGQFGFNFEEQYLLHGAERIKLTYKEAKLLKILSEQKGEVVNRESIQQEVWEDDGVMVSRSLDMFISKLRKKLKDDPAVEIKSIHGIGYKLIVS